MLARRRSRGRPACLVALVLGLICGLAGPVSAAPEEISTQVFTGSPAYRWTHVNRLAPNRSYWESDRAEGARVGFFPKPHGVFRSLFHMDTKALDGSKVHSALFRIMLDESTSCQPTQVDLWQTKPIDPAIPLTWNNSRDHWIGSALATASGQACAEDKMYLGYQSEALTKLVQRAADERTGFLSFGLRSPTELDPRKGMRFRPDTAFLVVEHNKLPDAPIGLNTSYPTTCGSADAPTWLSGGSKQFSARVTDADKDNLTVTLEILRRDGTTAHTSEVGPITSGSSFSWPRIPEGVLVDGEVYHYRARSRDHLDIGPYTASCYFTTDSVRPGTPGITSTDFPNGEPVIPVRTTGTVKLSPAGSDTDVVEYLFGLDPDRMTSRIKAGPDGTATVPITMIEDWDSFYAAAVDKAGNRSERTDSWDLAALDNPVPQAHVRGDSTGDGRADAAVVLGHEFGRTSVWQVAARDGGFHPATTVFDTGAGSAIPADRIRPVRGDFDGNGRTDFAIFRQKSDGGAEMWLLDSDGNRYNATAPWNSGSAAWPLATARVVSGDFDHDGKSDIAVQRAVDGGWQVQVFRGGAFGAPVTWHETSGDWAKEAVVAGDFDGDGFADLAQLRDQGDCRTSLLVHRSTGTAFADGVPGWDSGPGGYCADRATPVTGDVDHDGKDDIVTMYDHGGTDTAMVVFTAASGLTPAQWWRETGEFEAAKSALSTGDFDLDGREDLAVIASTGRTELWTLRSTGTAFADRVLGWQEVTGGVPARYAA